MDAASLPGYCRICMPFWRGKPYVRGLQRRCRANDTSPAAGDAPLRPRGRPGSFRGYPEGPGRELAHVFVKLQRLEVCAWASGDAAKRGVARPEVDLPRPRRTLSADDAHRVRRGDVRYQCE